VLCNKEHGPLFMRKMFTSNELYGQPTKAKQGKGHDYALKRIRAHAQFSPGEMLETGEEEQQQAERTRTPRCSGNVDRVLTLEYQ